MSGLGICSSVFRANPLLFVSERAKVWFAHFFFEPIAQLLFFKEWHERIAHGRSFVMSNLSKLLTVALLFRATWGICSRSLFKKETATERRATGAIWFLALKGGKPQKPLEKMIFFNFFWGNHLFLRVARATWVILSPSFCHEGPEQITNRVWAKERISNPESCVSKTVFNHIDSRNSLLQM